MNDFSRRQSSATQGSGLAPRCLRPCCCLLKVNSSYWNVYSVGQAIGWSKKGLVYGDINNTKGDVDVDALDEEEDDSNSDNDSSSPGDLASSTGSSSISFSIT